MHWATEVHSTGYKKKTLAQLSPDATRERERDSSKIPENARTLRPVTQERAHVNQEVREVWQQLRQDTAAPRPSEAVRDAFGCKWHGVHGLLHELERAPRTLRAAPWLQREKATKVSRCYFKTTESQR